MIKLIIQIPCLNEENTLPLTLKDIPKSIEGIDVIETLVIDDGSTDSTLDVARRHKVDHIVRHKRRKGLATTFMTGLEESLRQGADIIVNTDGDNQYCGGDISKIVRPILSGEADMVVGSRNMDQIEHFSWTKRKLQTIGSFVVRILSNTDVSDSTSGFRAFNRDAALKLNVLSAYTYTLETLIQAGQKQLVVKSVDVGTNAKLRESRLVKGLADYVWRSVVTMFRVFTLYRPLRVFTWLGGIVFSFGIVIGIRYLYLQFFGDKSSEHLASLILSAVLMITGFNFFVMGFLADLIGSNRFLIESILSRIKKQQMDACKPSDGPPDALFK